MQRSKGPTLQNENTHTKTENMLGNRLWNEENETFVVALLDCQTTIFEAACNTNTFVEAIGWQQFAQANWNEKCIFRVFLTVFFQYHTASKELSHMEKFFKKYVCLAATHFSFQSWKKAWLVEKNILYKHRAQKHSIIWSNYSVFG